METSLQVKSVVHWRENTKSQDTFGRSLSLNCLIKVKEILVMVNPAFSDILNTSDFAALSLFNLIIVVHWPDTHCLVESHGTHDLTPVSL